MNLIIACCQREQLILQRKNFSPFYAVFLYILLVAFFPLGVGTAPLLLKSIAVGVIWMSAMLVVVQSTMTAFQADAREGVIESLLFSSLSLSMYVAIKITMLWLRSVLPLVLLSPFLVLLYGLSFQEGLLLSLTLALGSLSMSFIVGLGSALTLSLREQGIILSLLVLPLMIPILIFGSGFMLAIWADRSIIPQLCVLIGFLILSVSLCPLAAASAIRLSIGRA
jgi:heme exporter protein B